MLIKTVQSDSIWKLQVFSTADLSVIDCAEKTSPQSQVWDLQLVQDMKPS